MKVETDIIARITGSPTGRAVMLATMYVDTFKLDIVFISNIIMCLISQRSIIFSIRVSFTLRARPKKKGQN